MSSIVPTTAENEFRQSCAIVFAVGTELCVGFCIRFDLIAKLAEEIAVLLEGGKAPVVPPLPLSTNCAEPAAILNTVKPLLPTAELTVEGDPDVPFAPVSVKLVVNPGEKYPVAPPDVPGVR